MKRFIVGVMLAALCTIARSDEAHETGLGGWSEAVITTVSADEWIAFLTEHAGWEVRARGPIDAGLRALWTLPSDATGEEVLLGNTGADRGFIRLVALEGVSQDWIRADTRPWDTGGHFDLNLRVSGLHALRKDMLAAGWQGDSEPIQFTFGPFEVIEWIAQGPDGVRLAVIERLKPELEGWPNLRVLSRTFNATQIVADMPVARAFYEEVLGMQTYLEHRGPSNDAGPNVLGLPHDAAARIVREVRILHPQAVNDGSIEILSFEGATGIAVDHKAAPHNIGLSVLRFPVDDLDATMRALETRGATFDAPPVSLSLVGIGAVRAAALRSPEGARLELFERLQ